MSKRTAMPAPPPELACVACGKWGCVRAIRPAPRLKDAERGPLHCLECSVASAKSALVGAAAAAVEKELGLARPIAAPVRAPVTRPAAPPQGRLL
jgi:hypothetical protein